VTRANNVGGLEGDRRHLEETTTNLNGVQERKENPDYERGGCPKKSFIIREVKESGTGRMTGDFREDFPEKGGRRRK